MSAKESTLNIAPFLTLAVIGLAVAKLGGWITASWWIVFSPWLLILGIWAAIFAFAVVVGGTAAIIAVLFSKKL